MDPKPMKSMIFGAKVNLGDNKKEVNNEIETSSIFEKDGEQVEVSKSPKETKEAMDKYVLDHSLYELGIELGEYRNLPLGYTEVPGEELKPFVTYVYTGTHLEVLGLNRMDTIMKVSKDKYSLYLPKSISGSVPEESELFVRIAKAPFEEEDYVVITKETLANNHFAELDKLDVGNLSEIGSHMYCVSTDSITLASISEGRFATMHVEEYAKEGYLLGVQYVGNGKIQVVKRELKDKLRMAEEESEVLYKPEDLDYMVDSFLFEGLKFKKVPLY